MKKTKLLFAIGVGMLCGLGAMAQSTDDLYSSHEASVDMFGFYGSKDKGGNRDAWGMGAGFNYFFTEYFGAGADTYMDAFTIPYLLNGQGIFRYPIKGTAIAPYAFGGFGRQWSHAAQWLGDIGVGAEYRFRPHAGAFFDAREVFPTETRDYAVLRFGIRFSFR